MIVLSRRGFSTNPKQKFGDFTSQQQSDANLPEFLQKENQKLQEIDFENIKGIDEFKEAIKYQYEKNYDEAEYHLKEGLKTLKQNG